MPRRGYTGLTNRACEEWSSNGKCERYIVKEYSMHDKTFREQVITFDFVCYISGKRFRVARELPGFVRNEYKSKFFGGRKLISSTYYDISNYEFLINARLRCFKDGKYLIDVL